MEDLKQSNMTITLDTLPQILNKLLSDPKKTKDRKEYLRKILNSITNNPCVEIV